MPDVLESVYSRAKGVILEPEKFFKRVRKERGMDDALRYLAVVALVDAFFNAVLTSVQRGVASFAFGFLLRYLFILAFFLVAAFVLHLSSAALGGRGSYESSLRALAYGYTPAALVGWIPWVGLLGLLYSLYLYVKGVSVLHAVSMWRSAAIVFLPVLLLAGLLFVVIVVIFAVLIALGLVGFSAQTLVNLV